MQRHQRCHTVLSEQTHTHISAQPVDGQWASEHQGNMSDGTSIMEFSGTHQAFRNRWAKTDHDMCRHSMSFHLHNTLRKEFFASYLHLLEQTPLGKNWRPVTRPVSDLLSCIAHCINWPYVKEVMLDFYQVLMMCTVHVWQIIYFPSLPLVFFLHFSVFLSSLKCVEGLFI